MEPAEYQDRVQQALSHYYRFLAKSLVSPGAREVLAYHRSALAEIGYPFSWRRLLEVVTPYWGYALRHPTEALRLVMRLPGTADAAPRVSSVPQPAQPSAPARSGTRGA
jgi:hypothetical protein